jgi:excisionase family DNA binding protein
MNDPILLKPDEAAHLLNIGRTKLWELVWSGELPVVRIGRAVRVPRAGLEAWVRAHSERAA